VGPKGDVNGGYERVLSREWKRCQTVPRCPHCRSGACDRCSKGTARTFPHRRRHVGPGPWSAGRVEGGAGGSARLLRPRRGVEVRLAGARRGPAPAGRPGTRSPRGEWPARRGRVSELVSEREREGRMERERGRERLCEGGKRGKGPGCERIQRVSSSIFKRLRQFTRIVQMPKSTSRR
jgi:hypothetical protein